MVPWGKGQGGAEGIKKGLEETSVGDDMFIILNVMTVSQIYTYVKAHQIAHFT